MKHQQVYVNSPQMQLALHWIISVPCDLQLWNGKYCLGLRYWEYGVKLEHSETLVMSSLFQMHCFAIESFHGIVVILQLKRGHESEIYDINIW